jgi:hypothetical protein
MMTDRSSVAADRVLPKNLDAERAVLGAVLLDNVVLTNAVANLCVHDFFLPEHRVTLQAFQRMNAEQKPIDLITVVEDLRQHDELESAGGAAYVSSLVDGMPRVSNVEHYARIIKKKAILRSLIAVTENIQLRAFEEDDDADVLARYAVESLSNIATSARPTSNRQLGRLSVAQLLDAKETQVQFLAWPILAVGLSSILDGLPKLAGKTRFYLEAIKASRDGRTFLGHETAPIRAVYVSEQSSASLGMQMREVGFTGNEPLDELMIVPRELWCQFTYVQMLTEIEQLYLAHGNYNVLIFDTWHTISRLEDENAAAEVNRIGNLTLDVCARNKLASSMSRHDRKSGGDVGVSGRSSIQLSGLVDIILHLVRVPGKSANMRKLQMLARTPGLPAEQLIELAGGTYTNWGEGNAVDSRVQMVREWLRSEPKLTAETIVKRFEAQSVMVSLSTVKRYRQQALEGA